MLCGDNSPQYFYQCEDECVLGCLVSLPAFMVPLFFRFEPDGIYVFMVIAGLIGVICLNGNGHYRITDAESTFQYDEKRHRLSYRHSDRASFQLTACIMIVSVIIGGVIMILKPADSFYTDIKIVQLRTE